MFLLFAAVRPQWLDAPWFHSLEIGILIAAAVALVLLLISWLTVRYIPNNKVGVVEKLWSATGSVSEGRIIALNGEAGFQADLLRGGLHFGCGAGSIAFTRLRWSRFRKARSATSMPATASRCRPARRWAASSTARTSRTPVPF